MRVVRRINIPTTLIGLAVAAVPSFPGATSATTTTTRTVSAFSVSPSPSHHHLKGSSHPQRSYYSSATTSTSLFNLPPYGMRRAMFGLEDQDTIKNLLLAEKDERNSDDVVFLDVRNPDEIAETSLKDKNISFVEARYLLSDCTGPDDELKQQLQNDLPKKSDGTGDNDNTTKFVVFCAKGGRAMKAVDTLKKLGYDESNIYNAGGISDVLGLLS
mmetsp:Transcript_49579/g.120298  ORF Transcript_49579/g.120298 Transcript_49579/m.120298 type:complete len:215 (+) Transcript_49579:113-757(+)|eukprot:CAMPEP_0113463350 /NCGR_PEP_ID=MMETSP0014_2-20120614/12598_1 /TAXON_ID=2857 /ORGANISM="Nitzschia sp." /LENGTH=214 /DNA_ID=CAMNT_0000355313 /DNA_START=22 /DNA_END=666 /DNA_ORIENTATION=+ /assembly_acc=CAM_ASM_000159